MSTCQGGGLCYELHIYSYVIRATPLIVQIALQISQFLSSFSFLSNSFLQPCLPTVGTGSYYEKDG